jgi:hypothetical protein
VYTGPKPGAKKELPAKTPTMPVLYALIVVAVLLATRVLPTAAGDQEDISSDFLFHKKVVSLLRLHGWRLVARDFKPQYPLLYHWFISHLSPRLYRGWTLVQSAVLDGAQVSMFTAVLWRFCGDKLSPSQLWLWAPLLLALHGAWLRVGFGPRAYVLNPRIFGEMLFTACLLALWMYHETRSPYWYCGAIFVAAVLVNSARFSVQSLLGHCIIIGALLRSLPIALLPVIGAAVSALALRSLYWRVFLGHVRHIVLLSHDKAWWWADRNSWKKLVTL